MEVGEDFGKGKGVEDIRGGEPPFSGDPYPQVGVGERAGTMGIRINTEQDPLLFGAPPPPGFESLQVEGRVAGEILTRSGG